MVGDSVDLNVAEYVQVVRKHRPNARILILEVLEEDVPVTAEWLLRCGVPAGHGKMDQICVVSVDTYSRHKRQMGVVDVAIAHNRYNVRLVTSAKKWKGVLKYLNGQRNPPTWHITKHEQVPFFQQIGVKADWKCGEPLELKTVPHRVGIPNDSGAPCGASNELGAMFCRECGRFRGIAYR